MQKLNYKAIEQACQLVNSNLRVIVLVVVNKFWLRCIKRSKRGLHGDILFYHLFRIT